MGCVEQTLPSDWSTPSLHSSSLLLLSEQVLFEPTVKVYPSFLAKLETMAIVTIVSLHCLTLELVSYCLFAPSASSLLLFLQFLQILSKTIALSYHCPIEPGYCSNSMSLWHIVVLIPLLNSSINGLPSYLLPLTALLNSCINSSIIFSLCSNLLNFATFLNSSSSSPNSFLMSTKNSLTISYSNNSPFRSSNIFFFRHLPILLVYMIIPTKSASQPLLPSSSSWYIICMLLQNLRPLMRSHQTLVALPPLCSLLPLLLFLLLFLFLLKLGVEPALLQAASVVAR